MDIKPIFSDNERNALSLIFFDYEHINRQLDFFLTALFQERINRQDLHAEAKLELLDEKVLSFKAFRKTLLAKPEFIRKGDEWKVQYIFHIITCTITDKKEAFPIYQVEINNIGHVIMGAENELSLAGDWRENDFIYNRLKKNLLCAILRWNNLD